VRSLAVPGEVKSRTNPVAASREVLESGMAHFADHCAMCHANDGSGSVEMGQHLFPPPPDMRAEPTQALTDGELFYIIENGVRFTGMPAFATGDAEGERASWELVRFVRSLPTLSADDVARMETMNPRPPDEIRREIEDEQFLQGGSVAPARGSEAGHKGAH
jgi:mono/diheme cytochrome c family protein